MTYVDFTGVLIIESLESPEPQTGTALFQHLQAHPNLGAAPLDHQDAGSSTEFLAILDRVRRAAERTGGAPLLHLEVHGNKGGLGLSGGDEITWREFADACRDINIVVKGHLVVTLAVCYGAYAISGVEPMWRAPFFGLIGSFDTEYARSLAPGFEAFYDALLTSQDFNIAHADLSVHLPRFRLLDSTGLFIRTYDIYRVGHLTDDAVEARTLGMLPFAPPGMPEQEARQRIRAALVNDDAKRRAELWENFVMADIDPMNAIRCPLSP